MCFQRQVSETDARTGQIIRVYTVQSSRKISEGDALHAVIQYQDKNTKNSDSHPVIEYKD